eukprot:3009877-Alexandrium_andersonii.AAC.1
MRTGRNGTKGEARLRPGPASKMSSTALERAEPSLRMPKCARSELRQARRSGSGSKEDPEDELLGDAMTGGTQRKRRRQQDARHCKLERRRARAFPACHLCTSYHHRCAR